MIYFMYFKMTCKFSNYFLFSCYENPFNFHQLVILNKVKNDRIRIKTVKVLREWVLRTDYYRQVQHQKAEAVHCFHRHSFWNG